MTPVEHFAETWQTRVKWSRSGFWCGLDDERRDDSVRDCCAFRETMASDEARFSVPSAGCAGSTPCAVGDGALEPFGLSSEVEPHRLRWVWTMVWTTQRVVTPVEIAVIGEARF